MGRYYGAASPITQCHGPPARLPAIITSPRKRLTVYEEIQECKCFTLSEECFPANEKWLRMMKMREIQGSPQQCRGLQGPL
ncbi:hypothetical protein DPEC_G00360230 [Dallia pectoralis]|uniref:Uncharacterized protein n=1 Tax=Dallia pectoralis TaxID=75939 RepID=A0ACC2F0U6_DALPE|nr:hypothetical protein DPEC_G00360230 [Dallia pectoralis]